jgi:hypothetical protein
MGLHQGQPKDGQGHEQAGAPGSRGGPALNVYWSAQQPGLRDKQ